MTRIERHVLAQLLKATALAVGGFVFVLLSGNIARDVLGPLSQGQLGWRVMLQLIALLIPYVSVYALPLGLLTGVLVTLGRMSSAKEIIALQAAGIPRARIVSPVFFVAILVSLASFWVHFAYAPMARTIYKERMHNLLKDQPTQFLEAGRFIDSFPGLILYVGQRSGSSLRDFWIWELDDQGRALRFIRAEHGLFSYDAAREALVINFQSGTAEVRRAKSPESFEAETLLTSTFEQFSIRLPMDALLGGNNPRRKLSMLTLTELIETRQQAPPKSQQRMAAQLTLSEKCALSLAALSLAAIAIPLSVRTGRSESSFGAALALTIGIAYYAVMGIFSALEAQPHIRPDLLLWLPNFAMQGYGLWWLNKG